MRFKTLRLFAELIELGSYSAVAVKEGLTQPAVSMQIKSLEDQLTAELVIKEDGKIKLTPAGKAVYQGVKEILGYWEKINIEVRQLKKETYGSLIIGASTIPSEYLLPEILARFSKKYSQIKVIVKVADSEKIIEKMEKGEVDIGIIGVKPQDDRFKIHSIEEDSLVLIIPKESRFAAKKSITIKELEKGKMIMREKGSGTREILLKGLREAGYSIKRFNTTVVLGSTEAVISAVEAGLGLSFVSKLAALKAEASGRVNILKVRDLCISRRFYLAYHKERDSDFFIQEFIESI